MGLDDVRVQLFCGASFVCVCVCVYEIPGHIHSFYAHR